MLAIRKEAVKFIDSFGLFGALLKLLKSSKKFFCSISSNANSFNVD